MNANDLREKLQNRNIYTRQVTLFYRTEPNLTTTRLRSTHGLRTARYLQPKALYTQLQPTAPPGSTSNSASDRPQGLLLPHTWPVQKVSGLSQYLKKGKSYGDKIWCALRGHPTRYPCKSAILCVNPVGNGTSQSGGMLGVSGELSFFKQCICNGIDNGSGGCLNGQKCC